MMFVSVRRGIAPILLAGAATLVTPGAAFAQIATNGSGEGETPDGSQTAVAVLYAGVDTTEAEKPGVITARDAEVAAHALAWPAGMTEPQKTAALGQLASVGIVAR